LFSADGIANVTMTAGETKNPRRNVPLSLLMGIGTVVGLYLLANIAYLNVLPFSAIQTAPEDRVGTLAAQTILGDSAKWFMAAAIMISTFGCVNGYILTGARTFWMMAQDRLFFQAAGKLDPKTSVPVFGLFIQCVWACLLTLSGKYGDLLDYVIFVALLIYMATVVGLMRLRSKRPDLERPYKVAGYPILPLLYLGLAGVISILLLLYKPKYTWPGLLLVISGIPVYFWMKRNLLQRKVS
jgi:basic amino acid/polyamine antiporter, APA family